MQFFSLSNFSGSSGFIVQNENAFGSDAGDSLQGFQKGSAVCLIETKSVESVENINFKVICGEL